MFLFLWRVYHNFHLNRVLVHVLITLRILNRKWLIIWNSPPCACLCLAILTWIGITWRLLVLWVEFLTINAQVGAGHPHMQLFIFVFADPWTAGTFTFSKADMTVGLLWNAGTFKCVPGQFDMTPCTLIQLLCNVSSKILQPLVMSGKYWQWWLDTKLLNLRTSH